MLRQKGTAVLLAACAGGRKYKRALMEWSRRVLRCCWPPAQEAGFICTQGSELVNVPWGGILVVGCVDKEGGGRKGLSGMYKTCQEYIDRTL